MRPAFIAKCGKMMYMETVKALRSERGWSQMTLAQRAGVSLPTIQRADANSEITDLTTARDNALAGLPAAISAVPNADIWTLLLDPMRARSWPCDTYYSSGTYWSVDFTSYC